MIAADESASPVPSELPSKSLSNSVWLPTSSPTSCVGCGRSSVAVSCESANRGNRTLSAYARPFRNDFS